MFPWAHVATETLKEARACLKPLVSVQAEQNLGLKTASVRSPEANEISIFLAFPLPSVCWLLSEPLQSAPVRIYQLHSHQTTRPTLSGPATYPSTLTLPSRRTSLICASISVTCPKRPGLGRNEQFKSLTLPYSLPCHVRVEEA